MRFHKGIDKQLEFVATPAMFCTFQAFFSTIWNFHRFNNCSRDVSFPKASPLVNLCLENLQYGFCRLGFARFDQQFSGMGVL